MKRFAWFALFAIPACPTTPPTDAAALCAALASAGCPEGAPDAGCPETVAKIQNARLVDLCVPCVVSARSRDAIHACRNDAGGPCAIECKP